MDTAMLIEMIGYLGSLLVVVSMLMSSVIKLRVINTVGSVIFAVYALIIHSYPTAVMNFFLVAINVYNLVKLLRSRQQYDMVEGTAGESFVAYFLDYYKDDIARHFPGFSPDMASFDAVYVVFCSSNPAGLLLGKWSDEGIEIALDYTTPVYRDCSVGKYLYEQLGEKGVGSLRYAGGGAAHESYLKKMGFVLEQGAYVKKLG